MKAAMLGRAGAWLAGVWVGLMVGIGGVAAPVVFGLLAHADAGRVVSRLLSLDASIGVGIGAVLLLVGLQLGRDRAERGAGSRFGLELGLALAALFCIVAGYYALLPMMEAARAGQGSLSFAALHVIASVFFIARLAIIAVLAWRLSAPPR